MTEIAFNKNDRQTLLSAGFEKYWANIPGVSMPAAGAHAMSSLRSSSLAQCQDSIFDEPKKVAAAESDTSNPGGI